MPAATEWCHGARVKAEFVSEKRLAGSTSRYENRPVSSCPSDHGWSQRPSERPLGAYVYCQAARTPVPGVHAEVWVAMTVEYRRLHQGRACLCRPFRNGRFFVL